MTIYERHKQHHFKWVLALIVLALGLTITFSEVSGLGVPSGNKHFGGGPSGGSSDYGFGWDDRNHGTNTHYEVSCDPAGDPKDSSPDLAPVPEVSTLVLVSLGLGAIGIRTWYSG